MPFSPSGPNDGGGQGDAGAVPASAMRADDAWDLKETDVRPWAHTRDSMLEELKKKLDHAGSPVNYLVQKYTTRADQETYARVLWQMLPPDDSDPPFLNSEVPGKAVESVSAKDVHVVHLATLSLSDGSMVGSPTIDR